MKRRIGLLSAAAILATVGFIAPASPAAASHGHCAGTGTATLSTGFGLPVLTTNTADFEFNLTVGVCTNSPSLDASGTVTGACGSSTGSGTANGDSFTFVSTGTVLVLTGRINGTVSAIEDPQDSGSCTNGTAVNFLITGLATAL